MKLNITHSDIPNLNNQHLNNQPVLRLTITDEDNFIFGEGFLTPFRRYCFQVSSNPTIGDDMGASPIIEYRKILNNLPREEVKDLLRGQAVLAIETWLTQQERRIQIILGYADEAIISRNGAYKNTERSITGEKSVMDEFINDCYDWIFN